MDDVSSECSSSPGTKTPNLVARLMGLDLLPENSSPRTSLSSPRPSSSSTPLSKLASHKHQTTRSLPATPRISTAARPSTELDYHHRLSLQSNKENKRRDDESRSEYAKQIAKQLRENISRRVGADITNTIMAKQRRDQCLVVLKPKPSQLQPPPSKENERPPASGSPRFTLSEIKKNLNKPISNSPLIKQEVKTEEKKKKKKTPMKVEKCKRIASEKYDLRLKKQGEPLIMKKCNNKKSTPLSDHLLNVNTTTKFICFKKEMASPSSTATLPQKQVGFESITQLPSCQSHTKDTYKLSVQDNVSANGNGVATGGSISDYISRILSHVGIQKTTVISASHWYSPSHPLHPSIFHHLENSFHPTGAANRKLIFDVVDELLVEILKPYISFKPWLTGGNSHRMYGWQLIETLCKKIECFPAADCRVLEDIDGLIEGDMKRRRWAVEEEAEEVVAEMEREMVETVVGEVAGWIIWHDGCGGRV